MRFSPQQAGLPSRSIKCTPYPNALLQPHALVLPPQLPPLHLNIDPNAPNEKRLLRTQTRCFLSPPLAYRICTNERGRCQHGICTLFGNCYGICDVSLTGARKRIEKTNTYAPPAGRGGRPVLGRVRGALGVPGDLYRADRGCRIPHPTLSFFFFRARAQEREREGEI